MKHRGASSSRRPSQYQGRQRARTPRKKRRGPSAGGYSSANAGGWRLVTRASDGSLVALHEPSGTQVVIAEVEGD